VLDIKKGVFTEIYTIPNVSCQTILTALDTDPTGNICYFGNNNGQFGIQDVRTKNSTKLYALHGSRIHSLHSQPSNSNILATASLDRMVYLWDLRKLPTDTDAVETAKNSLYALDHGLAVTSVQFSTSPKLKLATVCNDNYIRFWDNLKTSTTPIQMSHDNKTGKWLTPLHVTWDPKNSNVFICGSMKRCVDLYYYDDDKKHAQLKLDNEHITTVTSLNAIHPKLDILATSNSSGRIAIWK